MNNVGAYSNRKSKVARPSSINDNLKSEDRVYPKKASIRFKT